MQVIHFVIHIYIIWLGYISDNGKVITIQHQAWKTTRQYGTNSSHVPIHLLDAREGLGILLVFAKVQYGFLAVSSNICHGQHSLKKVFFEAPCRIVLFYLWSDKRLIVKRGTIWHIIRRANFQLKIKNCRGLGDEGGERGSGRWGGQNLLRRPHARRDVGEG